MVTIYVDSEENIQKQDAFGLAKIVMDSVALYQGESPEHFWGQGYQAEHEKTIRYIETIGLEEAKKRFIEKRLNIGE